MAPMYGFVAWPDPRRLQRNRSTLKRTLWPGAFLLCLALWVSLRGPQVTLISMRSLTSFPTRSRAWACGVTALRY